MSVPRVVISATSDSTGSEYLASVTTNGQTRSVAIPGKETGNGSAVNGGELLMLALATCYCNDLFREAALRGIHLRSVKVEAASEFGGRGDPGRSIHYKVEVAGSASESELRNLVAETDRVAEVHNTLRRASEVILAEVTVVVK